MLAKLTEIQNASSNAHSPLAVALEILFEHSPVLVDVLEPRLSEVLEAIPPLSSYSTLIDISLAEIEKWDITTQADFISGHPRIGESKNLSTLSAQEQGARGVQATPPEVLSRLEHLNACYELKYPGLRYITFVNGRTRAAIAEEMEDMLGFPHSLSTDEPAFNNVSPVLFGCDAWKTELQRAVQDIGRIAKSRLCALGAE